MTARDIHQIELGHFEPSKKETNKLADCLGVSTDFLCRPNISNYQAGGFGNYLDEKIDISIQQYLTAKAVMIGQVVNIFSEELTLPELDIPETNINFDQYYGFNEVEKLAEQARRYRELGVGPICNLPALIEMSGIPITYIDNTDIKVTACSVLLQRPVFMLSSDSLSTSKKRFALAYMLGRILMQLGSSEVSSFNLRGHAAHFAKAFLLPRTAFPAEFKLKRNQVDWQQVTDLEHRWRVSREIILSRAHQFSLIDASQYRASLKAAKKMQTTLIENESPSILTRALRAMWGYCAISVEDIACELKVTRSFLEKVIRCHIKDIKGEMAEVGEFEDKNVILFNRSKYRRPVQPGW